MDIETIEYKLPAHWASAIINGDDSGLSDNDLVELEAFLEKEEYPNIVDVSEDSYFSHSNDAGTLACDVSVYTALLIK